MQKVSQIRAWVEWQQKELRQGTESLAYLIGLVDRLAQLLDERTLHHPETCSTEYDEACDCGIAEQDASRATLLEEVKQ